MSCPSTSQKNTQTRKCVKHKEIEIQWINVGIYTSVRHSGSKLYKAFFVNKAITCYRLGSQKSCFKYLSTQQIRVASKQRIAGLAAKLLIFILLTRNALYACVGTQQYKKTLYISPY